MKPAPAPSLRSRLTLQAGLVIFVAVFICAASLVFLTRQEDRADLDASLLREAKAIEHILANTPSRKDSVLLLKTLLSAEPGRHTAEILHADGKIALISAHPHGSILIDPRAPRADHEIYVSKTIDQHLLRIGYFPRGKDYIAVAAQQEAIGETLQDLLPLYALLAIILLVIIIWGGALLANRALSPIVDLANASESITSIETTLRLPTGQADEEINRLSKVLNHMLDRLQASFGLVRRFTADAAHEIKTPLAIIQGHLEAALRNQEFSTKQEETVLLTLREVGRLNRLVEGLLLLSRSDAGRLELQIQPFDWSALTVELLNDAEILAAPMNLHLNANIQPGVIIPADQGHLRQVLLNLLDNACKYNRSGGQVSLQLTSDSTSARLEIQNTGPTIPPEIIPCLFERFQRGDSSRSRSPKHQESLGLGLSICREIVNAHGGQIELVSSKNDLTVFAVTLFKNVE